MARTGVLKPIPSAAVKDLGGSHSPKRGAAKKRRRNAMLMGEALELASTYDIPIVKGNAVVDVLQQVLDRCMDHWRLACKEVDGLEVDERLVVRIDEQGNKLVEPHVWMQYEQTLRAELIDLGIRMGHLGVDERRVRVQEAQVELLGRAVLAAAHAIGLDVGKQRELGAALRTELERLEDPSGTPNPGVKQMGPGRPNDKKPTIDTTAQEAAR